VIETLLSKCEMKVKDFGNFGFHVLGGIRGRHVQFIALST
jgi:hypothetical protein